MAPRGAFSFALRFRGRRAVENGWNGCTRRWRWKRKEESRRRTSEGASQRRESSASYALNRGRWEFCVPPMARGVRTQLNYPQIGADYRRFKRQGFRKPSPSSVRRWRCVGSLGTALWKPSIRFIQICVNLRQSADNSDPEVWIRPQIQKAGIPETLPSSLSFQRR